MAVWFSPRLGVEQQSRVGHQHAAPIGPSAQGEVVREARRLPAPGRGIGAQHWVRPVRVAGRETEGEVGRREAKGLSLWEKMEKHNATSKWMEAS